MADSTIILSGKPDSFESYELSTLGGKRIYDSFIEPELKVTNEGDEVLHQFIKGGYYYLQIYSFAQAFGSLRDGVVIGATFKSNDIISLSFDNYVTLKSILSEFKNEALDGVRFKCNTLSKIPTNFYKNVTNNIDKIKYGSVDLSKTINQSLLLFVNDFEYGLKNLEGKINLLNNVYISNSKDVFKSRINTKYFLELDDTFYIIDTNKKIVKYTEASEFELPKSSAIDILESSDEIKKFKNEILGYRNKYTIINDKYNEYKGSASKAIKILSFVSILFLFSTCYLLYVKYSTNKILQNINTTPTVVYGQDDVHSPVKTIETNNQINQLISLDDSIKVDSLSSLCINIKKFKHTNSQIYLKAIHRQGSWLGLDVSFIDKYSKTSNETKTKVAEKKSVKTERETRSSSAKHPTLKKGSVGSEKSTSNPKESAVPDNTPSATPLKVDSPN